MSVATYRARRPMRIGDEIRQPGELVPEANSWFRVDHLLHAGFLVTDSVSEEEYAAELARRTAVTPLAALDPRQVAEQAALDPHGPEEEPVEDESVELPTFSRAELEALELTELRELAREAGLETIKKAEIIDALAADETPAE